VLSLLLATIVMLIAGYDPLKAFGAMLNGAFGSANAVANTLSKSIPLMFTGFCVSPWPARAACSTIGGEGQLYLAALASAVTALALTPAARSGAHRLQFSRAWRPAARRRADRRHQAKLRINEVIVANLVNYIRLALCLLHVNGPAQGGQQHDRA
jgi:simple sugar transport system permease protein